jgi:hypothetical protein
VSCGKQLPEELRATGADVHGVVVRKPRRIDSPPVRQTFQLEVGCAEFLVRQKALLVAAARAVASLPPELFAGLQLFLINNLANDINDGWLRLSGHREQNTIVFFELVTTRIRHWFRKPIFHVALVAYLPPEALNEVIGLINDGYGLEELEKQLDGREAPLVFAAEVGLPVVSHAPGTRLVVGMREN